VEELSSVDRALFREHALPLYEEVAQAGSIAEDDARIQPGSKDRDAFDLLVRLGLLQRPSEDTDVWTPVDPSTIQGHVVGPLSSEGARLITESSEWARDFGVMAHAWRRTPASESSGPFTHLHGQQIISVIASLAAECTDEVLTAQPQNRRDMGEDLARALQTDSDLLRRGARMRTLYQHSARRSTATRAYVAAVTELGAEVRTLDEFFNRMLVFDRHVAVIPSPDSMRTALLVREPTVVAYLVDVFERSWERARPFTSRDATVMKDIAAEQRAMTMRMLIEGYSDPAAAKRLGVSPRTYAGYIADLKREFDVETRFQLGYRVGLNGDPNRDPETNSPADDVDG